MANMRGVSRWIVGLGAIAMGVQAVWHPLPWAWAAIGAAALLLFVFVQDRPSRLT